MYNVTVGLLRNKDNSLEDLLDIPEYSKHVYHNYVYLSFESESADNTLMLNVNNYLTHNVDADEYYLRVDDLKTGECTYEGTPENFMIESDW